MRRSPRAITLGLAAAAGLLGPTPTAAQECTYAACALRLQGGSIVAGAQPTTVTRLPFWSNPELRPWMVTSDSVENYVDVVEANWKSGNLLSYSGMLVGVVGFALTRPFEAGVTDDTRYWVGLGLMGAGIGLGLRGSSKQQRARDALSTAIWWYNGELEGGPLSSAASDVDVPRPPPPPGPTDYRRRGAVLGGLAGLGAGALVAHEASSGGLEGAAVTAGLTLFGIIVGRGIGERIPR